MHAELDHLVVTAPTLAAGSRHVENCLGIGPHAGGSHPGMGTHNRLLRLGAGLYLEVIAIDPEAEALPEPRWFGLDGDAREPGLVTWVARCRDLDGCVTQARHDPGPIRTMRRGELQWRIAFPRDGCLPEGGLLPPLIEWPAEARHPASTLNDDGLELLALEGHHPEPARLHNLLEPIGLDTVVQISTGRATRLRARIRTPAGVCVLD